MMHSVAQLPPQSWLVAVETKRVIRGLEEAGVTARFVGGCVRDAYLQRPVMDIDIAVDFPPKEICEILQAQGIKSIPTGLDHGTVTALVDTKSFQITTLRTDEKTDGRHAIVSFIKDWKEDARRRDFTVNALYADKNGYIFDPCGTGLKDLQEGRIRFIGDPYKRIEEDALRILRFFRFSAYYAKGKLDPVGLLACEQLVDKLPLLSAERVWYEFKRLGVASSKVEIFTEMEKAGVLKKIFAFEENFKENLKLLKNLNLVEKEVNLEASPLGLMAILLSEKERRKLPHQLKFSKAEKQYFLQLDNFLVSFRKTPSRFLTRKWLYLYGPSFTQEFLLINAAQHLKNDEKNLNPLIVSLKPLLQEVQEWKPVELPIKGGDLIKYGAEKGPDVSHFLEKVLEWWIEKNFEPTKIECIQYFRDNLAKQKSKES